MPNAEWWNKRGDLQAEYVRTLTPLQLYERTAKARDGKVIGVRQWFEKHKIISDKQAAVLAGWLAEEKLELDEEEKDDEG